MNYLKKKHNNLLIISMICLSTTLSFSFDAQKVVAADLEPTTRVVVIPLGGDKHYMYWQGEWTDKTSYKTGDGVHINGSSYICITPHTSLEFDNSPPDVSYWSLLAAQGAVGEQGLQGTAGTDGDPGPRGEQGLQGIAGTNGLDGDPGPQGEQGPAGTDGVDGAEGPAGSIADKTCPEGEQVVGFASNVPLCTSEVSYTKNVFVTSSSHTGAFAIGGVTVADNICQGLADAANLSGTYKAWISVNNYSPATNWNTVTREARYELTDGTTLIAESWADLTNFSIANPINKDENGNSVTAYVWSNTNSDGTITNVNDEVTCTNFTSADQSQQSFAGDTQQSGNWWSVRSLQDCNLPMRLYCFQQ